MKTINILTIFIFFFAWSLSADDIFQAARRGDLKTVRELLESNPTLVLNRDKRGRTLMKCALSTPPFGYTVNEGNRRVVKYLLEKGSPLPDAGDDGKLLHAAAFCGYRELVEAMISRGDEIGGKNGNSGTLLHSAAGGGLVELIENLLSRKFAVNAVNRYGLTPLHIAAIAGQRRAAEVLLAHGADTLAVSPEGKRAFHYARDSGSDELSALLLQAGDDGSDPRFPELCGKYLGQKPPGTEPELFAPGIVSTVFVDHSAPSFSPDGGEMCWSPVIRNFGTIHFISLKGGKWTLPQRAPFSGDHVDCLPVFIGRDRIAFCSDRPLRKGEERRDRLWYADKKGGKWERISPIEITFDAGFVNSQPAFAADRTLYFSSIHDNGLGFLDIYRASLADGKYRELINLGDRINSESAEYCPSISPDGSIMVFNSDRPGGYGDMDLYVSRLESDGSWGEPVNAGERINSSAYEWFGSFSPDGKYFFFGSNRNGNFDIYWVEAGEIAGIAPVTFSSQDIFEWVRKNDAIKVKNRLKENPSLANAVDASGRSLLMHALWGGNRELMEMLIEEGADVDARDNSGISILLHAVWIRSREAVELLIEHGADKEIRDNDGRGPPTSGDSSIPARSSIS